MKYAEIMDRIPLAAQNLKAINPPIKCYPVLCLGAMQFEFNEFSYMHAGIMKIRGHSELFMPGQKPALLFDYLSHRKTAEYHKEVLKEQLQKLNTTDASWRVFKKYERRFIDAGNKSMVDVVRQLQQELQEERAQKVKKNRDPLLKEIAQCDKIITEMREHTKREFDRLEFIEPDFELRFESLDMEAIQTLKNHPVVQRVGKTHMSLASIRIVIL